MEENTFKYKQIQLHWRVRLRSWLISHHDGRALLKQFESELHLNELGNKSVKPTSYPIAANEIVYLYHTRDKILIRLHTKDYAPKQIAIDQRLKDLENEHEFLKNRCQNEKSDLEILRTKLRSTKNPVTRLSLASSVDTASKKVCNTNTAIKECENKSNRLLRTRQGNIEEWNTQVKNVEKTIEIAIENYVKRAARRIESKHGVTQYTHAVAHYDDDIINQINGDY